MRTTFLSAMGAGLLFACTPAADPQTAIAAGSPDAPAERAGIGYTVGPCFGTCPVYSVDADETGEITFIGEQHTAVSGEKVGSIDAADYADAVAALAPFRPADGKTAAVPCEMRATDMQNYRIHWRSADGTQTVLEYYAGCRSPEAQQLRTVMAAMPARLGITDWIRPPAR